MARLGGMEVLRRIREADPDTRVIVMTGYASVASAVEVMKLGAFDYLPKPFTPQELRAVVGQALADRKRLVQNRRLTVAKSGASLSHQLIGDSPRIKKVIAMVRKVAPTDATVCITGESGTGKELIARAVHANSRRNDQVFFAVDCGTLSGNLLESELFGYVRGAFTGAVKDKEGIFKLADGGTVFLDEISNIGLEVQGKLLRFLETQEFLPLGSTTVTRVDVRLVFATNRSLECAWYSPPIAASRPWFPTAPSARTFTTAFTFTPSSCRRCGTGGGISCRSPIIFSPGFRRIWARRSGASTRKLRGG
jgi:DNA-binding NtrC family response regulator